MADWSRSTKHKETDQTEHQYEAEILAEDKQMHGELAMTEELFLISKSNPI